MCEDVSDGPVREASEEVWELLVRPVATEADCEEAPFEEANDASEEPDVPRPDEAPLLPPLDTDALDLGVGSEMTVQKARTVEMPTKMRN